MEAGTANNVTEAAYNSLEAMRLHGAYGYAKDLISSGIIATHRCWPSAKAPTSCALIIARQLIRRNPA